MAGNVHSSGFPGLVATLPSPTCRHHTEVGLVSSRIDALNLPPLFHHAARPMPKMMILWGTDGVIFGESGIDGLLPDHWNPKGQTMTGVRRALRQVAGCRRRRRHQEQALAVLGARIVARPAAPATRKPRRLFRIVGTPMRRRGMPKIECSTHRKCGHRDGSSVDLKSARRAGQQIGAPVLDSGAWNDDVRMPSAEYLQSAVTACCTGPLATSPRRCRSADRASWSRAILRRGISQREAGPRPGASTKDTQGDCYGNGAASQWRSAAINGARLDGVEGESVGVARDQIHSRVLAPRYLRVPVVGDRDVEWPVPRG